MKQRDIVWKEIQTDRSIDLLLRQTKECYGRVYYLYKMHEEAANICHSRSQLIRSLEFALLILLCMYVYFFVDLNGGILLGVLLAMILIIYILRAREDAQIVLEQNHLNTAKNLWGLRESYLSLLTDLSMQERDMRLIRQFQKKRDLLELNFNAFHNSAPRVPWQALSKIREDLEITDEISLTEKEIDQLLPLQFKRIKPILKFDPDFEN